MSRYTTRRPAFSLSPDRLCKGNRSLPADAYRPGSLVQLRCEPPVLAVVVDIDVRRDEVLLATVEDACRRLRCQASIIRAA